MLPLALRAIVFVLVSSIATLGALPFWAQLAGVEGPHVCHCSTEKHDCICVKCHPDRDDMVLSTESLKGRCGDDEIAFGGKAFAAIPPASSIVLTRFHVPVAHDDVVTKLESLPSPRPPLPPPEVISSSRI